MYTPERIQEAIGARRWPTMKKSLLNHGRSDDECWPWQGFVLAETGYGRAYPDGSAAPAKNAHRVVWELLNGPLSPAMHVDHRCHDWRTCKGSNECPHRRCVNPNHLAPATPKENSERSGSPIAAQGRKTVCLRGHEFDATHSNGRGRKCTKCIAIRARASRAARGATPRIARRRIELPDD